MVEKRTYHIFEDISLIRKELYSEINSIKALYKEAKIPLEVGNMLTETLSKTYETDAIEDMKLQISEINGLIAVLQDGFEIEKVSRRDVQEQLRQEAMKDIDEDQTLNDIKDTLEMIGNTIVVNNISSLLEGILLSLDTLQIHKCSGCVGSDQNPADQGNVAKMPPASDCADLLRNGHTSSGIYEIQPATLWRPLKVYCDMTTDGGGWTVFQRRCDGSENFYRNWNDYRFGFGNLSSEFWLGNEFIHRVTSLSPQELRIELEDFDNDRRYARYEIFEVKSAGDLFQLHLEAFSGNVTDSLISSHNDRPFSTLDNGPSTSCSTQFKGGWWYKGCHEVNINGLYLKGKHESYADGVNWLGFRGHHYSLKFTEMKFRSK